MKVQEQQFIRIVLLLFLGSIVLNSVVFADPLKSTTAHQFSVDLFSKQGVFQPSTSPAVVTYPSEILATLRGKNSGSQSGSRILDRYVKNSSTWLDEVIDQATAESIAIASLKEFMPTLDLGNYQLTSVQLVNTRYWGKEYQFEWTLKPNVKQTQSVVTISINGKTGKVHEVGSSSLEAIAIQIDPDNPNLPDDSPSCPFNATQFKRFL